MSAGIRALWTLAEIAAAVEGVPSDTVGGSISGVSIDTRTLESGDLFVALKGPNFDGHDFVDAAIDAGAAALLVETRANPTATGIPTVRVDDTQVALERLGAAARRRTEARIVAVTGSVGKTSTKEMLARALGASGATHWSGGSLNNHWGVPLSLARMPADARFGVFELGMNHAGEIVGLTRQVRPHVAVITTVEPVHLEFFASVEAIADAKAEIFQGIEPGGVAILNCDNPHFERLVTAARAAGVTRIVSFGTNPAEARLLRVTPEADGARVEAILSGRPLQYRLGVAGNHMALNSLAALAAAAAAGADPVVGAEALGELTGLPGRGRRVAIAVAGGEALLIDESYNASPASVRAAIAVLGAVVPMGSGRRIAVLGDMLELGPQGPALHRGLAPDIAAAGLDLVFAVGPLMRALWDVLPAAHRGEWHETAAAMAPRLAAQLQPGDVVMVKGSFGIRMAEIVKSLIAGPRAGGDAC
jgi:UDP-N-acetylmuramoyl-tripeptide--D-alanyl-D-alanine ligase